MGYKSGPKRLNLTPSRKAFGKAIARGSRAKIAQECLKDPITREHVIKNIAATIKSEIVTLCSESVNSILQQDSKNSIMDFSWDNFLNELKAHTPVLFQILQHCTVTKVPRSNKMFVISMCVAMLCKLRNPRMSLIHKIVALILYSGHSSKAVSDKFCVLLIVVYSEV